MEGTMASGLALSLGLGVLLASPQLWYALRYYPHSIRAGKTFLQKTELGNIPLCVQLRNMIWPSVEPVDGVFGPEACTFIGLPALGVALLAGCSFWWIPLLLAMSLAMGNRFILFRRTHWFHLRIPARYCYFVGLSLACGSVEAFPHIPERLQGFVVLAQAASLVLTLPRLWPMCPYVQRWERPSRVFDTPLVRFLRQAPQTRVSGLPYPLRTGQVNQLHTLGYNGGSQAKWMQRFRQDSNPNGSGGHDWFALNEDSPLLDWYGVRYAYTYRSLGGKWKPTQVRHLFENTQVQPVPSWKEVAQRYGNDCQSRYTL